MVEGTIENRSGTYITRTPLVLDEQGWNDLTAVLTDLR